jgi:hypothetical protein
MMAARTLLALSGALLVSACTSFSAVNPGAVQVGALQLDPSMTWNAAPNLNSAYTNRETQIWTQDGLLLNRIIIVPGIDDGETIFRQFDSSQALPAFEADMLAHEIEELVESSIVKSFGEGQASVQTEKLRPNRFGEKKGFMFDMLVAVSDGPNYRGLVGAFVDSDRLYLLMYFGAEPYYFDKRREEAESLIKSARL